MQCDSIKLILASASPRRKELIKGCFLNYEVQAADIDEDLPYDSPVELVEKLSKLKAKAVLEERSDENVLVIGSDTIVVLEDQVLGKPKNKDEAREMLKLLSGKTHEVLTGVALLSLDKEIVFYEKTSVKFTAISEDLLELYLDTGESLDKAGAYGIQGNALSFIEKVNGSYSNVVGLPVDRLLVEIKNFVSAEDDTKGRWREKFC